ncbi:MAG: hypothetical protein LWY06_09995 [Firmicutes bacterium]|nr:hypothetical protein [Bacillota bacterium]
MREIYIYSNIGSWEKEKPDGVLKGQIVEKHDTFIEIVDENGWRQIIVLDKVFAIVYQ